MKKVLSICFIIVLCFALISCENEAEPITSVEYEIGNISFSMPYDVQVDTRDEKVLAFTDGTEVLFTEANILDKGQFDKVYEDLCNDVSVNDVSKCEFAGMPTVSYFTYEGHPVYFLVDLDESIAYLFLFNSYTIEDEEQYVSIMQTVAKKEANQ